MQQQQQQPQDHNIIFFLKIDQNKKFFNEFIKENQNPQGKPIKQELRNDIYLSFLKDVKIMGNYSRVKRFSTAETINQIGSNSKSEDLQNLFSYLLQKHVEVYNWWFENIKKNKQNKQFQEDRCTLSDIYKRLFFCKFKQKKVNNDEEQYPTGTINSPKNSQYPPSQQGIASRCDMSVTSATVGRNSNQKQQTLTNESINVIYFNKKLDKNQYFKVNIVPLFLHEPFLSISFQDVSEFQLIKEKQIKEKGIGVINQQSSMFVCRQIEQLEKLLNGQSSKLIKQANKKLAFLKEILSLQQKNEKGRLELGSFQLNEIVEPLVNTFSNIKQLSIDKKLLISQNQLQLQVLPQNIDSNKKTSKSIFENQKFLKLKGIVNSLSCSELQNYDENIDDSNSNRMQIKTDYESPTLPEFGKDVFIDFQRKKFSNRIIPTISKIKTVWELQHSQNQLIPKIEKYQSDDQDQSKLLSINDTGYIRHQSQPSYHTQPSKNLYPNEETQNFSNTENSIYSNNQHTSLGYNKREDIFNQTYTGNNISNINFSFENLNNNNHYLNWHNQTTQMADYSFRGESPTYPFPKKLMAQKFMKQSIEDKLEKGRNISNSIIIPEEPFQIKPPITIYDKLYQNSNKFQSQLSMTKSFSIYNDKSLIQQVLVSLASSYDNQDIRLTVSQVQTQFYKSIKFQFEYDKCLNIYDNRSNTAVQLNQILGVKGIKYDQLKNKLLENINSIISQISPSRFKFDGNKLEVEFFYLQENYL